MKTFLQLKSAHRRGSGLAVTVVFAMILAFTGLGMTALSHFHHTRQFARSHRLDAFGHAENAVLECAQIIADAPNGDESFVTNYDFTGGDTLPYTLGPETDQCIAQIINAPSGVAEQYEVTSSATVGGKTRQIRALVHKNPPSRVFDYEYFLNNWGWWWGGSITGNGAQRSNWDFDFRYGPWVNGHVFAAMDIEEGGVPVDPFGGDPPFNGLAGDDPLFYCHPGATRVDMPNLLDFATYEADANGTIVIDGSTMVDGVHSTDAEGRGIYLDGTSNPIEINGTVVVHGDLIIKGEITGQGTLYIGGNLYIADDLTYANGPDFSVAPETLTDAERDAWVENANNNNLDLIAFAVRECILGGKVNTSHWKSKCYDNNSYGLKLCNDESNLGADGIRDTPDDGIPYDHDGDPNTPDTAWYDADGDGVVDTAYDYDNDLKMTDTRAGNIDNYPTDAGALLPYDDISDHYIETLAGILYTNHALGLRTKQAGMKWNGAMILRDEAIIFTSWTVLFYDSRIHSRYMEDPNNLINLNLPLAAEARILNREEIYDGGCSS